MIRIAFVIDSIQSDLAGTEKQLLHVLAHLDRGRFEPRLVCLRPAPWLEQARLSCPVEILGAKSLIGPDFILAGMRLARICRKHRIDIVQTFFRDANVLGVPWAKLAGVRVVVASRRSLGSSYFYSGVQGALLRFLSPLTTHYLTNSRAAARDTVTWDRTSADKVTVVPNALDLGAFAPIPPEALADVRTRWNVPEGSFVVGAVANLRPVKNLPFLVDAATTLVREIPRIAFVVLGEGPDRPALEARIRASGLEDRFLLPGSSASPARDIQAFDVGVLVSRSESSPNAVIEYMAAGRPAVVADVGGTAELVDHGRTGFVVPGEDAAAFRARISELASDPALSARMGQAARERASRIHDSRVVLRHLEDVYTALAQGDRPPHL